MALSTVTLVGDYRGPDSEAPAGVVEIEVVTRVAGGDQIVPAGVSVSAPLVDGLLSKTVVLSNGDLSGPLLLRITERIAGAPVAPYIVEPVDQGGGQFNLRAATHYSDPGLTAYIPSTARGAANGVAPLDGTGKVPAANLPASAGGGVNTVTAADATVVVGGTATDPTVRVGTVPAGQVSGLAAVATAGTYAALSGTVPTSALPALAITEVHTVASQAAMLALSAQRGDVAVRTDLPATFILAADTPAVLAAWVQLAVPADAVLSVAGQTGVVVLGLGDVTGLQAALDGKQAAGDYATASDLASGLAARVPLSLLDAAGDLLVGDGADSAVRLPVGTDDQVLTVDTSLPGMLKWAIPAAGGGAARDLYAERWGCKAITFGPHDINPESPQALRIAAQRELAFRLPMPSGTLLTGVRLPVADIAAGPGAIWFYAFQEDGSLLGTTGDVAAALSTGAGQEWRSIPFTAAAATTGAFVRLCYLTTIDFSTGLQVLFCDVTAPDIPTWTFDGAAVYRDGVASPPSTYSSAGAVPYYDICIGLY
jgi:hypothetical protein